VKVELQFGLDVIRSYRRLPYTAWYALAEFVDNSTQSYEDNQELLDAAFEEEGDILEVAITYDKSDPGFLRIADTAMGMNLEELQHALHVGSPPANTQGRSEFGLGLKTAASWIGNVWTVRTKKLNETIEYEVTVDVEAVANGNPELPLISRKGRDPREHYTIVEIINHNHIFQTRTLGKVQQYLGSMYRQDLRSETLRLEWQGASLSWKDYVPSDFLKDKKDQPYWKKFRFTVEGKDVYGWVGVLKKGSRQKAGFSILRRNRVVRGWPESWRPQELYGQLEGSNDLINQRLVGEIHLDAFEVTHTKSDILWMGDEEEKVQKKLKKIAWDYRETARTARTRSADERGPSHRDVQIALDELQEELSSEELGDAITLEVVPPPEVVSDVVTKFIESVDPKAPTFRTKVASLEVKGYLVDDASPNDPYIVLDSSRKSEVIIVINSKHPHFSLLEGSAGVLNYLRHCVYDGIAEWQARHKGGTIDPETIKMLKDKLLRVPFEIEMHEEAAEEGEEAA
jgi:Histidine kinase-, DNA gyrase B-, and HSP90-like ATPase